MKKAFVWVMMGILAVSMLAGCGKKETEPVISQPVEESVAEPEPEPEEPKLRKDGTQLSDRRMDR